MRDLRPCFVVTDQYLLSREQFQCVKSPLGAQLTRLIDGTESVTGSGVNVFEQQQFAFLRWSRLFFLMRQDEQNVCALLRSPLSHTKVCESQFGMRCSCGALAYIETEIWAGNLKSGMDVVGYPIDDNGVAIEGRVKVVYTRVERPTYDQVGDRTGLKRHQVGEILKRADRRYTDRDELVSILKGAA